MNLAVKDIRHNLGRFTLTTIGTLRDASGRTLKTGQLEETIPEKPAWLDNRLGKTDQVLPPLHRMEDEFSRRCDARHGQRTVHQACRHARDLGERASRVVLHDPERDVLSTDRSSHLRDMLSLRGSSVNETHPIPS